MLLSELPKPYPPNISIRDRILRDMKKIQVREDVWKDIHKKAMLCSTLKKTVQTIERFPKTFTRQIYQEYCVGKALCTQFLQQLSLHSKGTHPSDLLVSLYECIFEYPGVIVYLQKHMPLFLEAQQQSLSLVDTLVYIIDKK
jgi:hypothetical protein